MEREAFFARLEVAVAERSLPERSDPEPEPRLTTVAPGDAVTRFLTNLEVVDGRGHLAPSPQDAIRRVLDLMADHDAAEYVGWEADAVAVPEVFAVLDEAGHRRLDAAVGEGMAGRQEVHDRYRGLRVGITGAEAGLAATGSLVLSAGAGRPRMASLVPPVHIALLRASDIVPSLSHWIAAHPGRAGATANVVIVTGPSRTADIEQQLNLGVHGPGVLEVIVVADRPEA